MAKALRLGPAFGVIIWICACHPILERADLVIINGPDPESLDPAVVTGQAEGRVVSALFEGLTRRDPETALAEPGLAERWEISKDQKTYTFFIRPGARWSTGEPLTAQDFLGSWRRILSPETGASYVGLLFGVVGAEAFARGETSTFDGVGLRAPEANRFEVDLIEPTPYFLDLCAFWALAAVPISLVDELGDRWIRQRPLPCSGAYELAHWRLNDRVRLHKNRWYWDAAQTRTETVDFLSCSRPGTALNLYENGAVDIIWDKELIPADLLDVLRGRPDVHTFDYLGTYFLRFNTRRPPFDDARVRLAFAHAINRPRIVETITRGGEQPAPHLVPPFVAHYRPPRGIEYAPEKARALLRQAGYPGGAGFPPFDYSFNSSKIHQKIAIELQAMWMDVLGVEAELRQMEWKVFVNAQESLDYSVSRSSWIGDYNDPNTFLDLFVGDNPNNRTGWASAEYDALIRQANSEPASAERMERFHEAETLLISEEAPIVPILFYAGLELYRPEEIVGVYPNVLAYHPIRAIVRKR